MRSQHDFRDACLLAITEKWLTDRDLDRFSTPFRLERDASVTGKSQGGGVCLYVYECWCKSVLVRETAGCLSTVYSDHNCVQLIPLFRTALREGRAIRKEAKLCTDDVVMQLQGCFECTDWDIFKGTSEDIVELTDVISSYIIL